ncbi:glycosyltransferase family 2 protein [Salinicola acroporae]|uniref:Glycosyltransferase 2-like domain-containing protein n=1 Tax=Salinicola acroporae TaxID=1541440 RepID=A0ABT6I4D9_9GAMM|nr:glycosyltransferase [Salinicola acroporae]MDH4572558.1 hypothetical protein [Salinicola acroporae]
MLELPKLSLVIIVHDASHRVEHVVAEASTALRHAAALEFVVIDDASGESDHGRLARLAATDDRIRLYRQSTPTGGDAASWRAGNLARGEWIATLAADGRDDPHDIPDMLCEAEHQGLTLVEGIPLDPRCRWKRALFRAFRRAGIELADGDSCGLRLVKREALVALPSIDKLQRFLPLLIRRRGGQTSSYRVNLRAPSAHASPWQLAAGSLGHARDWLGMWWLSRRWHPSHRPAKRRMRVYAR